MIPLLHLSSGKGIYMDGESVTQEEALEIASSLAKTWGQVHDKVKARLLYEVEPKVFSECNHYCSLEEGLEAEGYVETK